MTITTSAAPGTERRLATAFRWHRPLMALAAAMAVLAAIGILGIAVDDRVITGLPRWAKPTKFALSILIYSVTLAWLISQLQRGRRVAWWAATVSAAFLLVEIVIITGQALRGTTSHFNLTTTLDAALWQIMGGSIAVVWGATLLVALTLFRNPGPDRARTVAVRAGAVLAVVGMALGFLMAIPTADQLAAGGSIVGAHTVGLADGGPGLPLLGWSTVGGDLRIPHFVGMHALQLIPLVAIGLELAGRGRSVLRQQAVRVGLIRVAVAGYTALLAVLTWQALRGQSIVQPDVLTGLALAAVAVGVGAGSARTLRAGRRHR